MCYAFFHIFKKSFIFNQIEVSCPAGWFLKPNWQKSGKDRRIHNNSSAKIMTDQNWNKESKLRLKAVAVTI
jgi:hypothetical protein